MSEEQKEQKIYIIKRVKKIKKSGHHGGSWKIAYADFVTAMMTFFLLMWLLSLLNKYQLTGISEYFRRPLKDAFKHDSFEKKLDKADEKPSKIEYKPKLDKSMTGVTSSANKALQVQQLQQMKVAMENKLEKDPELRQFKNQLNFIVTADGLKIELRDLKDKPMFSTGKADFEKYASKIVSWLSQQLNTYPNQIIIIGHTDGAQYQGNEYTNWELSADRANATRRVLLKAGMAQGKILRVIGVGDRDLLNTQDPLDPSNRRIEIMVLSDDAMKKVTPGAPKVPVPPAAGSHISVPAGAPAEKKVATPPLAPVPISTSAPAPKALTSVVKASVPDPAVKASAPVPTSTVPVSTVKTSAPAPAPTTKASVSVPAAKASVSAAKTATTTVPAATKGPVSN